MGTIAARQTAQILENAAHVIAIELLCGAQAMDLLTRGRPGRGVETAHQTVRGEVSRLDQDRVLSGDIEKVYQLIQGGKLVAAVEKTVGELD